MKKLKVQNYNFTGKKRIIVVYHPKTLSDAEGMVTRVKDHSYAFEEERIVHLSRHFLFIFLNILINLTIIQLSILPTEPN